MLFGAAVLCSTIAEFCWVARLMLETAAFTCEFGRIDREQISRESMMSWNGSRAGTSSLRTEPAGYPLCSSTRFAIQ